MNVGLVFGGPSVEHDISIITATQIYASIDQKKIHNFTHLLLKK